jgi:chromosome segregation ATPase
MEQDDGHVSGNAPEAPDHAERREEETGRDPSEDCAFVAAGDLVVRDMPEIKVLEHLKNETGTQDIGKTIKDLFASMQNMDLQLNSVLSINAALEKDIKASKDVIARLKAEREELRGTIARLMEELPSKRELQAEIANLVEERNEAQASIRSMKLLVEKTKGETQGLRERTTDLENEKADLVRDISYLDIKLNAAVEKLTSYAREITVLEGEKLSNLEKLENLRAQNTKFTQEKNIQLSRS